MALGQTVRAMLYAVSPIDPATLAAGVAVLLTIAGVAAYVPARRAAMVDAVRALRD
jgi:putative ABC transport system permease protein